MQFGNLTKIIRNLEDGQPTILEESLPEQQLLEDPNKDLFMQQDPANIVENV